MFLCLPALHMLMLPWSSTGLRHYTPPLFYFPNYYHLLCWFPLIFSPCYVLLSMSSLTCPCLSPHYSVRCINPLNAELNPICHLPELLGGATIVVVSRLRVKALHVVFLPCYSHGLRLRPSYCFVLDNLFINQILYFLLSTALMCLAITPVAVPSITVRLSVKLH
jgi:hypothetical protein